MTSLNAHPDKQDATPLFAPPPDALVLYPGTVMHARLKPFGHRFTYSVFSILIDIDRIAEANGLSPLFGADRPGFYSFRSTDHLDASEGAGTLREQVDAMLAGAGMTEPASRIMLLCYPRVAGYVFNPLSVFFAYGRHGELLGVVYAVRNTFGQRHSYVCSVMPGELSAAGLRQTRHKIFHVSPFIDLGARYLFRVRPPQESVAVRILETMDDEPVLSATFAGEARAVTTRRLAWYAFKYPFLTLKVMAGIHFEAARLWLKGALYHPVPAPPPVVSHRDQPSS